MNNKEYRSKSQINLKGQEKQQLQDNLGINQRNHEETKLEKMETLTREVNKIQVNSMRKKNTSHEFNHSNTYTSVNQDIETIQYKLRRIFEYYCQFGERLNITTIKSHKFYKLFCDCSLEDNVLNKTRIELIFSSENKHKPQMGYETFLQSLIRVADVKFSKEKLSPSSALQRITRDYILPLYDKLFETGVNHSIVSKQQGSKEIEASGLFEQKNSIIICNNSDLHFENDLLEIISIVSPILLKIYRVYFPFELSNNEDENFILENSQKQYFQFLKEFDVWPTLISKSLAFNIFQTEVNNVLEVNETYLKMIENTDINNAKKYGTKNFLGQYFNYFKFIRALVRLSDICFEKLETNLNRKLTMFEKYCLLLERLELSQGFATFELKTNKTHNRKNAKLIPIEIIDKVKFNIFDNPQPTNNENNDNEENRDQVGELNNQSRSIISKYRKTISGLIEKMSFEYTPFIQENWGNELHHIFKYYCSFGEPMNTQFMKNTKWTKFLKEAGLIRAGISSNSMTSVDNSMNTSKIGEMLPNQYGVKFNEIDTIFFKVLSNISGTVGGMNQSLYFQNSVNASSSVFLNKDPSKRAAVNSNAKMDFYIFLNLLEVTCLIILPKMPPKDAITHIITNHVLPLTQMMSNKNDPSVHVNFLLEKQTTPELVEILVLVHKTFLPIYKFYCQKGTYLMNFDQFLKFCLDFSIFPDIVAKAKLYSFFKSISACMQMTDTNDNVEYIDDNYFVDMMALCAFEVPYRDPQPSHVEKILYFVEKLSQTEGVNKILKQTGSTRLLNGESLDILSPFRHNYPDFFTIKVVEKPKFFDLLADQA